MNHLERADMVAADLVHACYGKLDCLSAVLRLNHGELRIIAPADSYMALAMMLYRAADEMAAHAPENNLHMRG